LIRERGVLAARNGNALTIEVSAGLRARITAGDSIAVNGVCLTAVRLGATSFDTDLLEATLRDTTLGSLDIGTVVNLEPALRAGEPLGGHLVQGHVDGTTELLSIEGQSYSFALPDWLRGWIVLKGSICIDGVSLTVQTLDADSFSVELIPETLRATNLGSLKPGQQVNLEADLIVKTISELLKQRS
jgi:riboflavin synthase